MRGSLSIIYQKGTAGHVHLLPPIYAAVQIIFFVYLPTLVDPLLEQGLAALAFSVMCRSFLPTIAPRVAIGFYRSCDTT